MRYFAVKLVHSGLGRQETQRKTLLGLGLKRLGQTVYLRDTAAIRGMIYKVSHLVELTVCEGDLPESTRQRTQKWKLQQQGATSAQQENMNRV